MYNPQRFRSEDIGEAFNLMEKYPFADVITIVNQRPVISHVPLTPTKVESGIELIGHLARANPHSKDLNNSKATIVFHGPHTFITPTWYAANDVPTWNYLALHVTGSVQVIEDEAGLIECLRKLTEHTEAIWPSGWDFYIPDDLSGESLKKHIIGFKVKVEEFNFKKKLSQNRSPQDRMGVMKGLELREDDNSREILMAMEKIFRPDGETKID